MKSKSHLSSCKSNFGTPEINDVKENELNQTPFQVAKPLIAAVGIGKYD